jgi:hypothetical protein
LAAGKRGSVFVHHTRREATTGEEAAMLAIEHDFLVRVHYLMARMSRVNFYDLLKQQDGEAEFQRQIELVFCEFEFLKCLYLRVENEMKRRTKLALLEVAWVALEGYYKKFESEYNVDQFNFVFDPRDYCTQFNLEQYPDGPFYFQNLEKSWLLSSSDDSDSDSEKATAAAAEEGGEDKKKEDKKDQGAGAKHDKKKKRTLYRRRRRHCYNMTKLYQKYIVSGNHSPQQQQEPENGLREGEGENRTALFGQGPLPDVPAEVGQFLRL